MTDSALRLLLETMSNVHVRILSGMRAQRDESRREHLITQEQLNQLRQEHQKCLAQLKSE